jgi:hypothetical protein
MLARLRPRLTFANVCSFLALLIALGTGSAYAANTVFSSDIVDGEVKTADLDNNSVRTTKIVNGQVANADLNADAVDGSKVLNGSVGNADLGIDSVQAIQIADDTIDGGEIIDNSLGQSDLATSSVGSDELASGSVGTSEVASNSLTAFDLAGGESNGTISLTAGYAANGACRDGTIAVGGANPGDALMFSLNGSVPQGILIYGVRVSSANTVTVKVCNFTGAAMAAITNLQVAVVTVAI